MIFCLFFLLSVIVIDAKHFNGGSIRWVPVDPSDNSSSIAITIIQSYSWSYPTISCTTDVPISTSGRSTQNANLTCVTDCSTDGGYSTKPVNILTDCISSSASLSMMTSQRSVNVTLTAVAHFYIAYVGSAWAPLNSPAQSNLQWSILSFIDLRKRSDGFINTPPIASVASPQYVIVNKTTQIEITVSDVNAGDDVRCRWSTYTAGYRRRKRSDEESHGSHAYAGPTYKKITENGEIVHSRKKRRSCTVNACATQCSRNCPCTCPRCIGTACTGPECATVTCTNATTTVHSTTIDTPGTLKSTSSYPHREAIDECGGICYPSSVPTGTTLSGCTLSFKGLVPNTWYAVAIQNLIKTVEDFINTTSNTSMSSVPVQFLIYVMPQPTCSLSPIIIPLTGCLEVTVGVPNSFTLFVLNLCDPNDIDITDIIVSQGISGMQMGNLTDSTTNASLVYATFTWTPQASQIGTQQLCTIAYTSEQVQSAEYCTTFIVTTSVELCKTTTTTSTSTTASTTSTTVTSTSTTTTSFISMSSTSVTTLATTLFITSSISISPASATTSATTLFTSSSSLATIIAAETIAAIVTTTPGKSTSWGLIVGISSLALPLALCFGCCLYRLLWSPAARRRQQQEEEEEEEEEDKWRYSHLTSSTQSMAQTTTTAADTNESLHIEVPKKSYQVYNILSRENSVNKGYSPTDNQGSILVSIYNNTNARRTNSVLTHNTEQSFEMTNPRMRLSSCEKVNDLKPNTRCVTSADFTMNKVPSFEAMNKSVDVNHQSSDQENLRTFSTPPFNTDHFNVLQSPPNTASKIGRSRSLGGGLFSLKDWTRVYLFGREPETGIPRIERSS